MNSIEAWTWSSTFYLLEFSYAASTAFTLRMLVRKSLPTYEFIRRYTIYVVAFAVVILFAVAVMVVVIVMAKTDTAVCPYVT